MMKYLAAIDYNADRMIDVSQGAALPTYEGTGFKFGNGSVGEIISALLPYIYTLAGIALLLMLIWGGITLMTAAGSPDKAKSGYGKIMGAIIGFIIVFISYFILQLIEVILGVTII